MKFWPKIVFDTFLYKDCKWENRYLYRYKYSFTKNWLENIYKLLLKYALIEDLLSILQLKVLNHFRDRRQHILANIIKDRASLLFVKHFDYLYETHAFLFQLVIFNIAPLIRNLFDLIICNFWILNHINAVFCDPLSPIDFKFSDHWLRRWNFFVKIGVIYSRYIPP